MTSSEGMMGVWMGWLEARLQPDKPESQHPNAQHYINGFIFFSFIQAQLLCRCPIQVLLSDLVEVVYAVDVALHLCTGECQYVTALCPVGRDEVEVPSAAGGLRHAVGRAHRHEGAG